MPTPPHEPEKVFEYVERVKALPPPTTIENAIHDERSYSFSAPTAAHRAGDRGELGVADSTPKFFGHPSSAASLPPLEAFDQPSTLRSTFERHHPRPTSSAAQGSPSSSLRRRNMGSRGGERRMSAQLSCDKISVQDMNGFIKGVGGDVDDCVTANDYAVRIMEALRTQYDVTAPMSTAPVAVGRRGEMASDASMRRLDEPLGDRPMRLGARNSVVDVKTRSDKETIAMLEREIRSQGFEIERLERRLRMRVTTTDVRLVENRAADLRESVLGMKQEVGFIAEDTFEAFAEFKREFEALPCVREIQANAPTTRARAVADSLAGGKGEQPALAPQSTFAPPADKGMSAGAVLRATARIVEAAAEVAGQRSGCPMPTVGDDKAELTRAMGDRICRGLGSSSATLPADTLDGVTAYTGTEAPNVNRGLRGALWILAASATIEQLKADLVARQADIGHLEAQLLAAEAAGVAAAGVTTPATSPKSSAAAKGKTAAPQAVASNKPPPKQTRPANPKAAPTPKAAKAVPAGKATKAVPEAKQEPTAPAPAPTAAPSAGGQVGARPTASSDDTSSAAVPSMPAEQAELNADVAPRRIAEGSSSCEATTAPIGDAGAGGSPAVLAATPEVRTPPPAVPASPSSEPDGRHAPATPAAVRGQSTPTSVTVPAVPLQDQLSRLIAQEPELADRPVRDVIDWLHNPGGHRSSHAQPSPTNGSAEPRAESGEPVDMCNAAAGSGGEAVASHSSVLHPGTVGEGGMARAAAAQSAPQPANWNPAPAATAATRSPASANSATAPLGSHDASPGGNGPAPAAHISEAPVPVPQTLSQTSAAAATAAPTAGTDEPTAPVTAPTPERRSAAAAQTPTPGQQQAAAGDEGNDDSKNAGTPLGAMVAAEDSLMASPIVAKPLGAATQSVLKFRVMPSKAATPPPNRTRTVDTTAAEAAKLERMRRALENGVQLQKFREHSHLLFDSRCEVQFPERARTGLSGLTPDPK